MVTTEEVLELVSSPDPLWETVTASGRGWQDRLANRDALAQRGLAAGRTPRVARSHGQLNGAEIAPIGQREQEWHLWRGGLMLVRSEYTIGKETVTVVGQGPRWWRWSPVLGATSGGGVGRPVRLLLGPPGALLDPVRLFEQLELTVIGAATIADRPVHRLRGVPIATRGRGKLALREAGSGADSYVVAVDAERGTLLSVEAFVGDRPFQRIEVTEITYDEILAPSLFSPERSSGERFVKSRQPQHLSPGSLSGEVDFVVFEPVPSPSSVAPYVALFDSDRRGFGPRHVVLTYAIVDSDHGRGQLRLTQAKGDLLRSTLDEWEVVDGFEVSEERHGRVQRRRIRGERSGTYVELESAILPLDELIAVMRSLQPIIEGTSTGGDLPPGL